jgi:hypothetical protein
MPHDRERPIAGLNGVSRYYDLNKVAEEGRMWTCAITVPKPYPIVLSGVTSSEKQIPRNC